MIVTYFESLLATKSPKYADVKVILDRIKSGTKLKGLIEQIRTAPTKEERDELKKSLPIVLFSGKFSERRASALLEYSQLICLDFDGVECIADFKEGLRTNPYVYAVWESPTGTGMKALVKVASNNHVGHALALLKEFPDADKNAIKDVCRACFVSLDTDIFINESSKIFAKIVESVHTDQQKYDKLKTWLSNKGEAFVNGNRNNFLAKLSGACNRFGISKQFVIEAFERDYVHGSDFSLREATSVVNSIFNNYADHFNTQSFENTFDDKSIKEILSSEVEASDIITVSDVEEDLYKDYDVGTQQGDTTYFPDLDECFRFMRGEQTTVTGISSSGKSTVLAHLLLIRAAYTGEKVGILSMEQYPPVFFYKELIRQIIGKPLEKGRLDRMTREEYTRGLEWVKDKFYFIYPESSEPTPEWTLGRFYESIVKYGVSSVVVDPYNSQSHDYKSAGGRDDRYIATMLRKNERFALQNSVHFFTVAHPRGIGKKEDGTYKEPSADEISGGPSWWQCSSNVLVHHRPSLPLDFKDTTCTLRSTKIKKQPTNGKPGAVNFNFNWQTGRFYQSDGFNPLNKFKL